jgi:amidase
MAAREKKLMRTPTALVTSVAVVLLAMIAQDASAQIDVTQVPRLRELDFTPFQISLDGISADTRAAIDLNLPTGSIAQFQAAMEAGNITSEQLTLYYLDRIARLDGNLRSMIELNPNALEDARAADALRAAGAELGPMHGIPVTLKDNIETSAPMHTTANAAILLDNVADDDAALVAQLRAAGAVILGKASLSEFAGVVGRGTPEGGNGAVSGQGRNPYGPFPVFGSSSGSAIGVSASLTAVSVGTETSGSLIAPAAVNGVVGMKPTRGLVSTDGVIPLVANNDSPGPIAKDVADAAVLLSVIDNTDTNYLATLSASSLEGVTVGVLVNDIAAKHIYSSKLAEAGGILSILGAQPRPVTLADSTKSMDAFVMLIGSGVRYDLMPYITARHPEIVKPEDLFLYNSLEPETRIPFGQSLWGVLAQISAQLSAEDHAAFGTDLAKAATDALEETFRSVGADVLISFENIHSPFYATAGYPAITVPMGTNEDGRPVGITFIGKIGQDAKLLSYAYAFEQATQMRMTPSPP